MTIKNNDVAFLKTTGEIVFVLEDPEDGKVGVRRPVSGQDGIRHIVEVFRVTELETQDEQRARFMAERKAVMEKYGPKTRDEQSDFADLRFGVN
jgi:hypothetical protein